MNKNVSYIQHNAKNLVATLQILNYICYFSSCEAKQSLSHSRVSQIVSAS